jgi:hypothetical protein
MDELREKAAERNAFDTNHLYGKSGASINRPDLVEQGLLNVLRENNSALPRERLMGDVKPLAGPSLDHMEEAPVKGNPGKQQGVSHLVERDADGNVTRDVYFRKGDTREVFASRLNDTMGLNLVSHAEPATYHGVAGSVQDAYGPGFEQPGKGHMGFKDDPKFADNYNDMVGLDNLMAMTDRHGDNVMINQSTGEIGLLDHHGAGYGIVGMKSDGFPSEGRFPDQYTPQFLDGFNKLTPDVIQQKFSDVLSPEQLQGLQARREIMRLEIESRGLSPAMTGTGP